MNQKSKDQESKLKNSSIRVSPTVFLKIGGLTVGLALVIYFLGYFLDRLFNTSPLITFGMLGFSAPLVIWLNTIIIRRETAKISRELKDRE